MPNDKEIKLTLTLRQICDLELIFNKGFSPLKSFMGKEDYISVVEKMRLKNGTLWPIPIVFDINDISNIKKDTKLVLCDEYGTPLASMIVNETYKPDKLKEAKFVYGTSSINHSGVDYLLNKTGKYYLGGTIKPLHKIEHYDFQRYRLTPNFLKQYFKKKKIKTVIGFQTRNPIHKAHFAMLTKLINEHKGLILLSPAVGPTKEGDIDYITRVHSYIKVQEKYLKDSSMLALLPFAMRMAGPREAIWHAIIRKNYGCTHFIIGRDHASPGKDQKGKPFYGTYSAQKLAQSYENELGIKIITFNEMVYVEEKNEYLPIQDAKKNHTVRNISGTQFRQMIRDNESIPEWFSFPEVINEVKRGITIQEKQGVTIFFTGLPSAGKSTLARMLYYKLLEIQSIKITLLDGDIIRRSLSKGLGFSREDRNENIKRIGFVAKEITKHGGIAICAAIAPFEESRKYIREEINQYGNYVEIYVSTPLNVCIKRDTKNLYKEKTSNLTGVDDPYEIPKNPDIILDTSQKTARKCIENIINYLLKRNLISQN